jgi:hypothetical protein
MFETTNQISTLFFSQIRPVYNLGSHRDMPTLADFLGSKILPHPSASGPDFNSPRKPGLVGCVSWNWVPIFGNIMEPSW